jgi:hypothetical protein
VDFPMSSFSQFFGGAGGFDMSTFAATGFAKPSIVLFDTRPGTRDFVVPAGVKKIRAFVVGAGGDGVLNFGGAGGGYSEKEYTVSNGDVFTYTVATFAGGTSSFNSDITATGGSSGSSGGLGGVGSGGDINTSGGNCPSSGNNGGSSSGNRYGNGRASIGNGGAGWGVPDGPLNGGGSEGIDGFGIGLLPGAFSAYARSDTNTNSYQQGSDYGCGGPSGASGGIGGGGGRFNPGGIGGGGGGPGRFGFGVVGIEVLEVE